MSKMRAGSRPDLAQAGQVLAGGVQDPLLVGHDLGELGEVADRRRIEEERARAAPEDLDQVGALRVAEAGRALGVDRERPGARAAMRRDGVRRYAARGCR